MEIRSEFSKRADVDVRAALETLVAAKRAVQRKVSEVVASCACFYLHTQSPPGSEVRLPPLVASDGNVGRGEWQEQGTPGCCQL